MNLICIYASMCFFISPWLNLSYMAYDCVFCYPFLFVSTHIDINMEINFFFWSNIRKIIQLYMYILHWIKKTILLLASFWMAYWMAGCQSNEIFIKRSTSRSFFICTNSLWSFLLEVISSAYQMAPGCHLDDDTWLNRHRWWYADIICIVVSLILWHQ